MPCSLGQELPLKLLILQATLISTAQSNQLASRESCQTGNGLQSVPFGSESRPVEAIEINVIAKRRAIILWEDRAESPVDDSFLSQQHPPHQRWLLVSGRFVQVLLTPTT